MSTLSFFQPAYLWGLAALAAPFLIHFLNRKRNIKLDFSTMRFFRKAALRSSKKRRLRRILLLCTRMLLITVIVVIFTKPYDSMDAFSLFANPDGSVYCWIDNTKSMDYKEGATSVCQKAFMLIDSINKHTPESSGKFLYSPKRHEFLSRKSFSCNDSSFTDYAKPDIGAMVRTFKLQSQKSNSPAVLAVISDFQENICKAFDSAFTTDTVGFPVLGVTVAPVNPWNISIQKVYTSCKNRSSVVSLISCVGKDNADVAVSLFTGGIRSGHENPTLKNGIMDLSLPLPDSGKCSGYVKLDSQDPLSIDNTGYFVLNEKHSFRILILGDTLKSFPIAAAFRSIEGSPWRPVILKPEFKAGYDDIDSADIIILNEIRALTGPLQTLFSGKVFTDKAIIVSPAIDSGSVPVTTGLLRMLFKKENISPASDVKPHYPVFYDTVSPLWKGFPRLTESNAAIYRYIRNLPGNRLLGFDNNNPMATNVVDSARRSWIIFAAPLGMTESNNLCRTGIFVPLLDITAHFALEAIHGGLDEWVAGKPARNPFSRSGKGAFVYDDRNKCIAQWGNQPFVLFDEPGIYKIQPQDGASYYIAVNPDSSECSLIYSKMKYCGQGKNRMTIMNVDEFLLNLKNKRGIVYSYILWCALGLLIIFEMLLWERPVSIGNF
ncbi:MAG TPA: hypothetical protein DCO75_03485 [Fibrobacteres bacterium]|nr:hypothetical protein [Fibrobacterota bacterium]